MPNCRQCQSLFKVFPEDQQFYEQVQVPDPTLCPFCRHIRRHGFVNDYAFYTRSCDHCQKHFVSIFPSKSDYKVYCSECWWSESRDDKAHGRDYDPNRPFFKQFDELMHAAPQLGIIGAQNENCDYCESVANCRNCYLISESSNCEDCYFCYWIQLTKNSLDCNYCHECERCYELEYCFNCFNLKYSQNCFECSDSAFLDNCVGSKNCLFSTNLRHKEFYIFNKLYSKAVYEQEFKKIAWNNPETIRILKTKFQDFLKTQPRRAVQVENSENVVGDYIRNAKNCRSVFHCYDAEECAYGEHVWRGAKYCYDSNTAGRNAELLYETTNSGLDSYNVRFCRYCWGSRDTEYCNSCKRVKDCFGCVSLKPNAQYCILNRQYSKSDYEALVSKIKAKMRANSEYGEFFPLSMSLFGYNNTVSFADQPLSREEALARGWKWEDQKSGVYGQKDAMTCENCQRNYKIIDQERRFYEAENIPVPCHCHDCRLRERLQLHHRKVLVSIACSSCTKIIQTTLDPKVYSTILCEACHLKILY